MHWTNLAAAIAMGALAWYLFSRAEELAKVDGEVFKLGARAVAFRLWSHRVSGVFLGFCAIAVFIDGFT